MSILITALHVVVAVFLILVVLLQTGKRADLAGAFGGGGSQTAFGTRGAATLLSKLTTGAAVLFMLTSLTLSIVASRSGGSGTTVLENVDPAETGVTTPLEPSESEAPALPPVEQDPSPAAEDVPPATSDNP